jgi:two-component system, OmpR family, heavy metal sensor histidine kinase CusS
MFSKRTKPRSIASQQVLLFTLAATCLLCSALGVFYWMVVRHAFEEDNAVLADKVSALSADLSTGGPAALEREVQNVRAGERAYWIRLIDAENGIVTETPEMNRLLPPAIFPTPQDAASSIAAPKDYRKGTQLFSLVATTVQRNNSRYTLQLAQDRSTDEKFKKNFGILLAAVLFVGVFASALIAITVTKRGLRPLAEMTRSFEQIGPTHLSERVAPAAWPRELQPLAVAFDDMLDRLEESFTRLSQFSADLAHELRTPIANIMGEAQVTLTRARTSDEYRDVIESTAAECERLSAIVDSLLFLARTDAAREHIERTPFDGRAALEKIAAYYETIAEDRHIVITLTGEGEVLADQVLFNRTLSNVIDNALRFTPDGGAIRLSLAQHPAFSEITVSDTGAGIEARHLPRLFDRFYRVDPARSSRGVGLGLALVKSIVDLHGGSAAVESEINRGTTVRLIFPR